MTLDTRESQLRVKRSNSWLLETKMLLFAHIFVKSGLIYTKQEQTNHRTMLHNVISLKTLHQQKLVLYATFVCELSLRRSNKSAVDSIISIP